MKKRFNLKLQNDSTSSAAVAEAYRRVVAQEYYEENLALIHYRGGEEEYLLGVKYAQSKDVFDRIVGADILGQLGWNEIEFLEESLAILIPMLQDEHELVVSAACYALGHRSAPHIISHVLHLAPSASPKIRHSVVFALLGHDVPEAIDTLITLSRDTDMDVRNWAMFGLGTQIETTTKEITDALFIGTTDEESEIRGEALVGLAIRKDPRIVDLLLMEWEKYPSVGILSLEAAEATASPRLFSSLSCFLNTISLEEDLSFVSQLNSALAACQPKIELASRNNL